MSSICRISEYRFDVRDDLRFSKSRETRSCDGARDLLANVTFEVGALLLPRRINQPVVDTSFD